MSPTTLLADPSIRLAGVRPRPRIRRQAALPRLRWRVVVALAALALAVTGLGYLQTWPPLATVMSASMEPTIKTGDMVVLKRLDGPARVGDVVSIPVPDAARARLGYPPVVIHRIVRIDRDGAVTTKGDAHKEPDAFTVPRTALTTKVVGSVPAGGRVLAFLGSPLGLLWLVGGGAVLLGMPLFERHRLGQRREQGESADLHAALQAVTQELVTLRDERQAAVQEAAQARDQLAKHLEQLPTVIERAVAAALAAHVPPPPPPPPTFIPASQWKPPTPDLLSAWDTPPTGRFKHREDAVDFAAACSS